MLGILWRIFTRKNDELKIPNLKFRRVQFCRKARKNIGDARRRSTIFRDLKKYNNLSVERHVLAIGDISLAVIKMNRFKSDMLICGINRDDIGECVKDTLLSMYPSTAIIVYLYYHQKFNGYRKIQHASGLSESRISSILREFKRKLIRRLMGEKLKNIYSKL